MNLKYFFIIKRGGNKKTGNFQNKLKKSGLVQGRSELSNFLKGDIELVLR